MRRHLALLLVLLTLPAFASPREPGPRLRERHMVITPARVLTEHDRAELAAKGVVIQQALTGGRFLARVRGGIANDVRIASAVELSAGDKIDRSARRELARAAKAAKLSVIFHRDVSFEEAREAILASGAALEDPLVLRFVPTNRIDIRVADASVDGLLADDRVFAIAGPRPQRVAADNATSAAISHVTELYSAPYDLTGAGVTVSLFELGQVQASHVEFGGRLTIIPTRCGIGTANSAHATHVAGTIGAAGLNAAAKGMAPAVRIFQNCVDAPTIWLNDKEDEVVRGITADNNSWGFILGWSIESGSRVWNGFDDFYGAYDLIDGAPIDRISNENNILFVHSAGNDGVDPTFSDSFKQHLHVDATGATVEGKTWCMSVNGSGTDCPATCNAGCELAIHHPETPYDTMGLTASAKNVLAVGAVDSNKLIAQLSSRGPAKDGRVKPDVVARGVSVLSSVPTNSYARADGTSMAAPVVTGIAALLTEQWRRTYGRNPHVAELRGLIIAGAEDLGRPGPDYTYGFGLVNAKTSVDLVLADEAHGKRIRNYLIADGQTVEAYAAVTEQGRLRIVLTWADPDIAYLGGDSVADKALVNDLDVRVIDPSGQTILPYVLNRTQVEADATRGVNHVDNTEMVEIANAAPGLYRIIVSGTNVLEGPQEAVLVSNRKLTLPCTDLHENNDQASLATPVGSGALVSGAFCSDGDVDFYALGAVDAGPVSIQIDAGDGPLHATLSGTGVNTSIDIPAHGSATLTATAAGASQTLSLALEPIGPRGVEPTYSLIAHFNTPAVRRLRGVRH